MNRIFDHPELPALSATPVGLTWPATKVINRFVTTSVSNKVWRSTVTNHVWIDASSIGLEKTVLKGDIKNGRG